MKEDVEKALDLIRPALARDRGDIRLISVEEGVVKVQLTGACGSCPMSQMTMKAGVEQVLRENVPGI